MRKAGNQLLHVFAGAGTDVIVYSNSTVAGGNESYLEGGAGNDTIYAAGHGDMIMSGADNDYLRLTGGTLVYANDNYVDAWNVVLANVA